MKIKGKDVTDGATSVCRAYYLDRGAETNFKYKKKAFSFVTKK